MSSDQPEYEPEPVDEPVEQEPQGEAPPQEPEATMEPAARVEQEPLPTPVRSAGPWPYIVGAIGICLIVVIVFAVVFTLKSQERSNQARSRLARGQSAMVDGDMYRALYEFTMALELDPRLPGAHAALGRIAIANAQGEDALRNFNDELSINSGDRQSRLALGCIYTLGCVPSDDPHQLRGYLLRKFSDVTPLNWPQDFAFSPGTGVNPLDQAVFHFQFALEHLPSDPAPEIGLALVDVANYKLSGARERLSRLVGLTTDETTLSIVQGIIEDINREEEFQILMAHAPESAGATPDIGQPLLESMGPPLPQTDGSNLSVLPPLPDIGPMEAGQPSETAESEGQFGARDVQPIETQGSGAGNDLGLRLTDKDLLPQPTVKPISKDIHLQDSDEFVHTVRLANMYQQGNVGFREGEIVVMPYTNTEVKVVEFSDKRIVLQEHGNMFVWVPADVGWVLEPQKPEEPLMGPPAPESETPAETDQGGNEEAEGSTADGESDGSGSGDSELGPEVH